MKICILVGGLLLFCLSSCVAVAETSTIVATHTTKVRARITYYYSQPPYWNAVACPRTKKAQVGVTIAAHPDFKLGTQVYIPKLKNKIGDGKFVVQDRGPAVTNKTASRGKAYVFDVYVTNAQYSSLIKSKDVWMDVYIQK